MRLAIGDIHGRIYWKYYLKKDFTEFYFTGDYFDSHNMFCTFTRQYKNFLEICERARKDRRLKLCLGNHDYHYLSGVCNQRYSGFQHDNYKRINEVLELNMDLIEPVRVTADNYIISHAGVTNYFLNSLGLTKPEDINGAFQKDRNILNFRGDDIYGDDITQSPIWIRPRSLFEDALSGYSQIVGHTPMHAVSETATADGKNKLVFIDTHDVKSAYEF
ncbi:MAG: metallophosphoesterase [Treponema sp.]|jgi:hypothetical protein|nr:metallophosphoesterase [Treponema sp.]